MLPGAPTGSSSELLGLARGGLGARAQPFDGGREGVGELLAVLGGAPPAGSSAPASGSRVVAARSWAIAPFSSATSSSIRR